MFVKLCQIVGARADVFPAAFIEELGCFHDRVPARPFSKLAPLVESELGRSIESVFCAVEPEPIAAASLAQVHLAVLRDGSKCALKIQYPEIRRLARVDLGSLRRVVRVAARLEPRLNLRALVDEVAKFIELELDFSREASSTERVRKAFAGSPDVVVPEVHRELCSGRVLVLEYLCGVRVVDLPAVISLGHDPRAVAQRIGRIYATMIFEHGFFHGDPHPGNLLVLPDGRIGLLDFGLAKELPPGFAVGVARMLGCAFTRDMAGVAREATQLGFDLDGSDPSALEGLFSLLMGQRGELGLGEILSRAQVRRVPEDFALIVRTLILLNGLSHRLAPGERPIQVEMARAISLLASKNAAAA
jgi:ubiquinone biosynthesis protein